MQLVLGCRAEQMTYTETGPNMVGLVSVRSGLGPNRLNVRFLSRTGPRPEL